MNVLAAGRAWQLMRPGNLEEMWNAMEEDSFDEDRIPYWLELWPSSACLADWLAQRRAEISGRHCLDLGCGLGLTAIVGQWLGASVVAVDRMLPATLFCLHNARLNGVDSLSSIVMDWRTPAARKAAFFRLWAADIIYERRFFEPVISFLDHVLEPAGVAWLAEPGRAIFRDFLKIAGERGWLAEPCLKLRPGKAGNTLCTVWQLARQRMC